jgi:hypothetical protein
MNIWARKTGSWSTCAILKIRVSMSQVPSIIVYPRFSYLQSLFSIKSHLGRFDVYSSPTDQSPHNDNSNRTENQYLNQQETFIVF